MTNLVVTTLENTVDAGDGVLSLREAITAANANADASTITFDASLLTDGKAVVAGGSGLRITEDVRIFGDLDGDGSADITVAGMNGPAVFQITGGDVEMDGLVVTNGGTGGVDVGAGTSLIFSNGVVTGNTSSSGGGGIRSTGDLTVIDSLISDNTANDGGGIYARGKTTIIGTTISGNSGNVGGGADIVNSTDLGSTIVGSTISDNVSENLGGGIRAAYVSLRDVAIIGNFARSDSGGARLSNSTVENATIVGNSSGGVGGLGLYLTAATNVTVTGNTTTSTSDAGGVRLQEASISNSIVAGNGGTSDVRFNGDANVAGSNLFGTVVGTIPAGSNSTGIAASDVFATVTAGAGVVSSTGWHVGTVALKAGTNVAVNAAGAGATTTDARGYGANGARDIGAYERDGIVPLPQVGATIAPAAVDEDTPVSFAIGAGAFTSGDGDLTLTAFLGEDGELPDWLSFDPHRGRFAGTPPAEFSGDLALRVVATDANGATASQDFTLRITAVNDAPVAASDALVVFEAIEETAFDVSLPAGMFSDVEGDVLTYSATLDGGAALPGWLTIDPVTGGLSGTGPENLAGVLDLSISATDGGGLSATRTVYLFIGNTPDAPVASTAPVSIDMVEDQEIAFALPDGLFENPDDTPLTFAAEIDGGDPLPAWLAFDPEDGTFAGTPPADFNGELSLRITATGTDGLTADRTITLAIAAVDDPIALGTGPVDDPAVTRGRAFDVALPEGLFANPDDDVLTYAATLPGGADLPDWMRIDPATGRLSGTPGGDDTIPPDVLVTATDEGGRTATATVSFAVTDAPAPELTDVVLAPAAAQEDEPFALALPKGLFAPGIGATTVTADGGAGAPLPDWMRFDAATMSFSGTPPANFAGDVAIRLVATDEAGNAVERTFVQTFENVPDAPVVKISAATVAVADRAPSPVDLSAYVTDADGELPVLVPAGSDVPVHVQPFTLPSGAILSLNAKGALVYTPSAAMERLAGAANGVVPEVFHETVELSVTDGIGGAVVDTLTFTFTVEGDAANDDWVFGGAAGDTLFGRFGRDRLLGREGDDTLIGNGGGDRLNGGEGRDGLHGHKGADSLFGAGGDDLLMGGRGRDSLGGGTGDDVLRGGLGQDVLRGRAGEDVLHGGIGADRLDGGGGSDRLIGAAGKDLLLGGAGADAIGGGQGDDVLRGGGGRDDLRGRAGDDVLEGGAGNDVLRGGQGRDTFVFAGDFGTDVLADWGRGDDVIDLIAAGTSFRALDIRQNGDDAVIDLAADDARGTVVLRGVDAAALGADDFLF